MEKKVEEKIMITKIPGIKAQHAIITDNCRNIHGTDGAFVEAIERLKKNYDNCVEGWDEQKVKGVNYHLVLVIQRPGRDDDE